MSTATAETAIIPTVAGTFKMLALSQLVESPMNNRKHYDEKKLTELTESIRAKWILTPLLVRPKGDTGYEIAAGHRRYRAATRTGLDLPVPAVIREMSDAEFLEVLTIENLQREDVHPMDEALGYKELVETHGYTADTIADKVGKSKEYVYGRMKLADLLPEIQVRFYQDELTPGHAILLARLTEANQIETVRNGLFNQNWQTEQKEIVSVRELAAWIKQKLHLEMKHAPFSPKDADLVPGIGACLDCPKRTGSIPKLWPDVESDTCTDRTCYDRKAKAFVDREIERGTIKLTQYGQTEGAYRVFSVTEISGPQDKCGHEQRAIIIDGHEAGKIMKVCVDTKCPKHGKQNKNVAQAAANRERGESPAAKAKRLAEEKEREEKLVFQKHLRQQLFDEISADASKVWPEHLSLIALALYRNVADDVMEIAADMAKEFGFPKEIHWRDFQPADIKPFEKLDQPTLARLIVKLLIVKELETSYYGREENSALLNHVAKIHSIDVKSVEKKVRQEMQRVTDSVNKIDNKKAAAAKGKTAKPAVKKAKAK